MRGRDEHFSMNILALESSGASVGVAAWRNVDELQQNANAPLSTWGSSEPRALSREIIRGIDETLQRACWDLDEVDALAIGLGPGSWTSLRIGLATGKTLAQARNWRLIGVPTLDALAASVWHRLRAQSERGEISTRNAETDEIGLPSSFVLLALAHCRAGEVYGKIFACRSESLDLLQAEFVDSPQAMAETAMAQVRARDISSLVLIGTDADAVASVLESRGEAFQVVHLSIEALAFEIARCGHSLLAAGRDSKPLELQPLYIAPSAAERNFKPRP